MYLSVEHRGDPDFVPPDGLGDLVEGDACRAGSAWEEDGELWLTHPSSLSPRIARC